MYSRENTHNDLHEVMYDRLRVCIPAAMDFFCDHSKKILIFVKNQTNLYLGFDSYLGYDGIAVVL